MSRFSKIIVLAAVMMAAAACSDNASIEGTLSDAPSSEVVGKLLNVNYYEVLDTVKTDAAGRFSYKAEIAEGQPEFIYVFYKDSKVASLLLEAGDKVKVTADTLGNYSVEGSEESAKLAQVEKTYADALVKLSSLSDRALTAEGKELDDIRRQIGQEYVNYYRNSVRYVMENSKSLTVIPVFYQVLGGNLSVFGQPTDAIHFMNVSDSLATVYPDSKYVKVLKDEADKRFGYLELESRIKSAQEVGFVDVELPDITGVKQKLSEVDAKVVMLHFWTASDANQKMFNLDFLKRLYDDYHSRGFEIYQISLDVDKAAWASVVRKQDLPWINVCDIRGASSPYAALYNIPTLPAAFIIADGELVDGEAVDEKSLRRLLEKHLK